MSCEPRSYVSALLKWYAIHGRDLAWRTRGRNHPDPYQVWVSEIMLQQTTVTSVTPYFERFLARFPKVEDLAGARLEEVLTLWQGLGYYARARHLHRAARQLVDTYGGVFPQDPKELIKLPGIGPYTAAAIASMAYDAPCIPVDGNVARVFARVFQIETPLPNLLEEVRALVPEFVSQGGHHGDLAQALMDLGATVCTPVAPSCEVCPWREYCLAYQEGAPTAYPKRLAKKAKPVRYGVAFVATCPQGAVLLRRRPPTGLLASLMEVPTGDWVEGCEFPQEVRPPFEAPWQVAPSFVRHTFTHFQLRLKVWRALVEQSALPGVEGTWVLPKDLPQVALPTLMKKVIAHGVSGKESS